VTGEECAGGCGQPLTQFQRDTDRRPWHPRCVPPGTPMLGARPAPADDRPVDTITPGDML
jgi:hypothetical protein